MAQQGDFTKGGVASRIVRLAAPMTAAQLINVLYSVVDRMYIGHLPDASASALTGIGVTFPILSIVIAFASLFGMGGAPLFSIARGKGEEERAAHIMGNTFVMLVLSGVVLTSVVLVIKKPLLFLFGASAVTYPYADGYITIYLLGSVFVMLSLGMNSFINAQGFGKTGMMTVALGAAVNLVLDPLFLFVLRMGVRGAALATVLSQFLSALWAVGFLMGRRAVVPLRVTSIRFDGRLVRRIMELGMSGFIMAVTNSAVQIVCNATLKAYGGDLYVGVMTIINSIREVVTAPVSGFTSAAQPVLGYNYGARAFGRTRQGIRFLSVLCVGYTTAVWLCLLLFPGAFIRVFNNDPALVAAAVPAMHVYFFGFFMMSLQMSAQSATVALGKAKQAIFFSLLRKAVIVIPLTLLLPRLCQLGTTGVFLAEPVSNVIGGSACFGTMLYTIGRELKRGEQALERGTAE